MMPATWISSPGSLSCPSARSARLALDGFGDGNDAGKIANLFGVLVERVAGDEEAQHFLFIGEALALFPVGDVGQIVAVVAVDGHFIEEAEEAGLAELGVLLRFLGALHGFVDGGKERAAGAQRVEGAGLDERLDDARIHHAQVDLLAEFPEALEAAADFIAGLDDGFDGVAADVLDRGQAEADGIAVRRELRAGDLHVGRLDRDAHLLALADVLDDVFGL